MTPDDKRLKEIGHRRWEISQEIKRLKKEDHLLSLEAKEVYGMHRIERAKQKYRSKGKVMVRK